MAVKQTREFPLMDFSAGMNTKSPKEMIPANALPYCANVMWDEKNRISKIWGTTELMVVANNAFAANPIYKLYNFIETNGTQNLIIQGQIVSGGANPMRLWVISAPLYAKASTTVTNITPSGVNLASDLRCNFSNYRGKLYMANGSNHLMSWSPSTSNPTTSWKKHHPNSFEKFTYLCAWNPSHPRLWMAHSPQNPIRVIYTDVNGEEFSAYYGDGINPETGDPYVGNTNWMDFPTNDGTPITGLAEFEKSLLVFKPRHIFRIYGDPIYGVTIACVAEGLGCVCQDSIKVRNDGMIAFMAEDGIWAGGDIQVYASPEDQVVRSKMTFAKLTSEIDNYWDSYVTVPNVYSYGSKVWAGATDLGGFTLSGCAVKSPTSTKYEPKIMFTLEGTGGITQQVTTTSNTNVVALRSYYSSTTQPTKKWYAQTLYNSLDYAPGTGTADAIPWKVELYTTKTGTIGASHKLTCQITATKVTETAMGTYYLPDFSKIYAEGQVSGNTDIKHQDWTTITFTYWPTPQNLYDGSNTTPLIALVIIPEGDDASNCVNWSWVAGDTFDPKSDDKSYMINSDQETPSNQPDKDYSFKLYTDDFSDEATVITDGFKCTDTNFTRWRNIEIIHEDRTFNDYTLNSQLVKVEYDTGGSGASASWTGTYTETVNGGEITATDLWIRFKFTYVCFQGYANDRQDDSFSLMSVKLTWQNQATLQKLASAEFWDDRYILACDIADSGG